MRMILCSIAVLVVSALVTGGAVSQVSQTPQTSNANGDVLTFRTFLRAFEEGTTNFVNGNAVLWKQHASQHDDATIMGGWGGYAKGWKDVGPWYDWAVGRFHEGGATVQVEYLTSGVSSDLAYTVAIERSVVRVSGEERTAPMALRVTHIFRKENGGWKLLHRHADPLTEKTSPSTVLQKKSAQ